MSAKNYSATVVGLDAPRVEVEADISPGLPNFTVVGLPDAACQESRERVKAAIKNSGLPFPHTRVIVNLAPANVRKEGSRFDAAIAAAVLAAAGVINPERLGETTWIVGELALDGRLRHIPGALAIASAAVEQGARSLCLPQDNSEEAAVVRGLSIYPIRTLTELVQHLNNEKIIAPAAETTCEPTLESSEAIDLSQVRGQEQARRVLEIAAAGGHNLLLTGPPGSGKTLLARTLPGILPPLTFGEALEVTKIWSVAGTLPHATPILWQRPFRSPHHTASAISLVGGGTSPRPGEVSLALAAFSFSMSFRNSAAR